MSRAGFNRSDRVAALLRREVASLVHHDVRDGLVPEMSVSDVEISRDLAHATVYVTALSPDSAKPGIEALNERAKSYRQSLAKALALRHMPQLYFRYDDSIDRGEHIDSLLRGLS